MANDIIARGMAGNVKKELDKYKNNPDVADIVYTKADLDNYDTSKLSENDIVKVLVDETQDNKETYYKWVNNQWDFIGGIGPFYTQEETNTLLASKQDTMSEGTGINLVSNEISVDESYITGQFLTDAEMTTLLSEVFN